VASILEGRDIYRVLVGKPEYKRRLEDPGIRGKIKLTWTLRS
jgi:hypothetical protein